SALEAAREVGAAARAGAQERVLLAAVVLVDGALAVGDRVRDVVHREAVEPALEEQALGDLADPPVAIVEARLAAVRSAGRRSRASEGLRRGLHGGEIVRDVMF